MNRYPAIIVLVEVLTGLILFLGFTQSTTGQGRPKLIQAKDGSGIIGYKDTPILPWCGYHVHDPDRPAPKKVNLAPPGTQEQVGSAPSDAVILFDGNNLSQWKSSDWKIENGELIAISGNLTTKQPFGDCQLHLEWQAPDPPQGSIWDRGNNGVMLILQRNFVSSIAYKVVLYKYLCQSR